MISIEQASARYTKSIRDAHARHDGLVAAMERQHAEAVKKAEGTYRLAVQTADDRLAAEKTKAHHGLPQRLADADIEFDTAVKRLLSVPTGAFLRRVGPSRLEVYGVVGGPLLATAVDEGARWVVTTETEIRFFGDPVVARTELWRVAAALPVPAA
jgi:hypothetical protein